MVEENPQTKDMELVLTHTLEKEKQNRCK